jgi:hypothetical protein
MRWLFWSLLVFLIVTGVVYPASTQLTNGSG